MKKMKLKQTWDDVRDEIAYSLHCLCEKLSPVQRFIIVLILFVSLSIACIYIVVSSVYSIGKRDAEKELQTTNYELIIKH